MKKLGLFIVWLIPGLFSLMLFIFCEPLVETFDDMESAKNYRAKSLSATEDNPTMLRVMTWNIRFGAARIPWFGDSCGDKVILKKSFVTGNLQRIADKINETQPDILLLQEIDVQSKRSAYIDEVQWLLDHTHLNYGAFASVWKAQFIPSDGLGRMNMGNAILSRWPVSETQRIQLQLRGDQDALTKYFYLRRCIVITKINLPNFNNLYAVNIHASAFSTDDTKQQHIDSFKLELDKIDAAGGYFIAGGDLNELPPGATKTDYCLEDMCDDESYHQQDDDPFHKEGSYFTPEVTWLIPLFETYQPAVTLQNYLSNESHYFSSTPDWTAFYNRKIDYLFTNRTWIVGTDSTHHDAISLSDHCPVSAIWEVPQ